MTHAHTPGPWKWDARGDVSGRLGRDVAKCDFGDIEDKYLENLANARLIAAAPDLLAALEQIATFNDHAANARLEATGSYSAFDEPGSVQIARAALAKAKGR